MLLIDSHIHLDSKVYSEDLPLLIYNAISSGVEIMITPGTTIESSRKCVNIANEYDGVFAAVGVHPHDADNAEADYISSLKELAAEKSVVAIGEIGLDFNKNYSSTEAQTDIFKTQIKLAQELDLPMIIHNRDSDELMEEILLSAGYFNGVIHCYTGGLKFAKKLVEMGFLLGFTGITTFGVRELEEVIKRVPMDRLLVETDGPYMTPVPHRGKRNEPSYVLHVAEKIAELKEISLEELADLTTKNCLTLFERINVAA